ncbi:MAG: hypothetical protein IJT46_08105 [Bacteroidaceae bacterium]|nr:hypothetical protein [Bacteroidaceae bacterium]
MRAWLKPFGYSDAINDAAINFILREFVGDMNLSPVTPGRKLTAQVDQLQKMVKNLEDKNQRHNKHAFGKSC